MNLVFNELSIFPITDNGHIAEERFKLFLETFREAKKVYDFRHIHFPKNYASLQITSTETFFEWVSTITNRTLKNLIIDLCRKPFIDELEEAELDAYFESNFSLIGNDLPTDEEPVGLPIGYIKTVPTISLDSSMFWRNRKILIRKSNESLTEDIDLIVYNTCLVDDMTSTEINEWADVSMPKFINSEDVLKKYLGFTKYQTVFSNDFMDQFLNWKDSSYETFKYILLLMKDVQVHPFSGGMGQTENLKGRGKEASKRITNSYPDGDRLSYYLENNVITFVACKGHYEFH